MDNPTKLQYGDKWRGEGTICASCGYEHTDWDTMREEGTVSW